MTKHAHQIEIHNDVGHLLRIEFYDAEGEHVLDALWDDKDEQTTENRREFRTWAYKMLERKGYKVGV